MPRTPPPDDDAALRWDDVDDPSWVEAERSAQDDDAEGDTDGDTDVDPDSDDFADRGAPADRDGHHGGAAGSGASLASRIVTAAGALLYLAYSIAWIVGVSGLPLSGPTLVLEVLYQFAEFLAIVASALWFGTTIVLTSGRLARRAGWLALGALVLLPWPFVLEVVA